MDAIKNNFMCYTYKKRGKDICSSHYIRERDLVQIILDDLRRVTHFARQKEALFAEYINRKNSVELRKEMNSLQRELDSARRRDAELTPEILRLFISRIEVGEKSTRYSRTAEQAIRIVYRDVGIMDSVEQVTAVDVGQENIA